VSLNDNSFIEDLHNALTCLLYRDVIIGSIWYLSISKLVRLRFSKLLNALGELFKDVEAVPYIRDDDCFL
jgi:hypothetical protein